MGKSRWGSRGCGRRALRAELTREKGFSPDSKNASAAREQVKVLLGFRNWGDVAYNLTLISGSLNVPGAFSQYVQNLTTLVRSPFACSDALAASANAVIVQYCGRAAVPYESRRNRSRSHSSACFGSRAVVRSRGRSQGGGHCAVHGDAGA